MLAKGIDIEEYERRTEKFNIHGCWEWSDGKIIIYELPSMPHEVGIGVIAKEIVKCCINADGTDAVIHNCGATSKYQCYNILLCL